MTFVDSSAWYAAYVPTDPRHSEVSERLRAAEQSFVTTDFVVDETITLMLARRERQRAIAFGQDMLITGIVPLEMVSLADMVRAYQFLITYRDKDWSFTDCTSLVVMQRLGIREAVSLDQHFRQMPGIVVYP